MDCNFWTFWSVKSHRNTFPNQAKVVKIVIIIIKTKCILWILCTNYIIQIWCGKPSKTDLVCIEDIQKKATRWKLNSSAMPYNQTLEKIRLLPLSLNQEKHELLFFHKVAFINYNCYVYDHDMPYTKSSFETRPVSKNTFLISKLKKQKSKNNFFYWLSFLVINC